MSLPRLALDAQHTQIPVSVEDFDNRPLVGCGLGALHRCSRSLFMRYIACGDFLADQAETDAHLPRVHISGPNRVATAKKW